MVAARRKAAVGKTMVPAAHWAVSDPKITLRLPEIAVTGAPIEISASVSSHLQFLVADIADQAGQTTRLRLYER